MAPANDETDNAVGAEAPSATDAQTGVALEDKHPPRPWKINTLISAVIEGGKLQ